MLRVDVVELIVAGRVVRRIVAARLVVVLRLLRIVRCRRRFRRLFAVMRRRFGGQRMVRLMVVVLEVVAVTVTVVAVVLFAEHLVVLVIGVVLQHQPVAVVLLGLRVHLLRNEHTRRATLVPVVTC